MQRALQRRWLWVALLAVLGAPVAYAQNLDPTSTQNVAVATGEVGRAGLEAQRKLLFTRMLADPSNLDLAFEYAALSERAGDLEAAISTLERMLVFAPGLPRLQFEVGILYYRLGSWNTAKSYFTTVLAAPGVPDDIRTQIGAYMVQIEDRQAGSQFFGEIAAGLRYQTNANAGPDSPFVTIGGVEFELDPGALGQDDVNGFGTVRLHNSVDLESQGDRFDFDLSAYGALYDNETDLDTGIVEVSLGPNFNLQGIGIDNARLALHGDLGTAMLGGDPYLASVGFGADLIFALDARGRLTLSSSARYENYYDSDLHPNASLHTGERYSVGARYDYLVSPGVKLYALVDTDRVVAQEDYFSNWSVGLTGGLAWDVGGGGTRDPWTVSLSAGVNRETADAADLIYSADAEVTDLAFVSAGLTVPLAEDIALNTSAVYTVSNSNYDLSNYDNLGLSMALSKKF